MNNWSLKNEISVQSVQTRLDKLWLWGGSIAGFLVALTSASAYATSPDQRFSKKDGDFSIQAGFFRSEMDSHMRVDGSDRTGSMLNLEDDLGFKSKSGLFLVEGEWRFLDRHRVSIGYIDIGRHGSAVADEWLKIGESDYPPGSDIYSNLNLTVAPIRYSYSLIKNSDYEISATLGAHWFAVDFDARGKFKQNTFTFSDKVNLEASGPLLLVGGRFEYQISPSWEASLQGEWMDWKSSTGSTSIDGAITNLKLSAEYLIHENWSVGASLLYFNAEGDLESPSWTGVFEYNYQGPLVYLEARF